MNITPKEAKQLNDAKAAVLAQWKEACFTQGIPADSKFVVFADTNEAAKKHNDLIDKFFKLHNRIAHNLARRERHAKIRFAAKHPGTRVTI